MTARTETRKIFTRANSAFSQTTQPGRLSPVRAPSWRMKIEYAAAPTTNAPPISGECRKASPEDSRGTRRMNPRAAAAAPTAAAAYIVVTSRRALGPEFGRNRTSTLPRFSPPTLASSVIADTAAYARPTLAGP